MPLIEEVPVMPYLASFGGVNDVVLSLISVAPTANLRLTAKLPRDVKYKALDLTLVNTNLSVLASLGFGDTVSAKSSSKMFCSYMDLCVSTTIDNDDKDSIVARAKFGLGFRLAITAFDVDVKYSSSFASIAAAAKLKMGYTNYQVVAIGGGLKALEVARPLISNLTGDFTIETVETIGSVQSALTELYIKRNDGMTPELLSVDLNLEKMAEVYSGGKTRNYRDLLRGQAYALQRAQRQVSSEEAVKQISTRPDWSGVSKEVVQDFYARILDLQPGQKPRSEQVKLMLFGGT